MDAESVLEAGRCCQARCLMHDGTGRDRTVGGCCCTTTSGVVTGYMQVSRVYAVYAGQQDVVLSVCREN